jgi:hypothetical protein
MPTQSREHGTQMNDPLAKEIEGKMKFNLPMAPNLRTA